ncbi:MAG: type II toxin-antitoxin system RelE/ParE family toxin [Armatimonadetes bacterium]|nr:type II toxin-antitoxin system RelE/ParE family toxin [Armatimonadota bacterium]
MRRLDLTRDAAGFWERLDAKQYRQIGRKMVALMAAPLPPDSAMLRGSPYRRADIGEYRVIYRFDDLTVYVARVGKRNDDEVYR